MFFQILHNIRYFINNCIFTNFSVLPVSFSINNVNVTANLLPGINEIKSV